MAYLTGGIRRCAPFVDVDVSKAVTRLYTILMCVTCCWQAHYIMHEIWTLEKDLGKQILLLIFILLIYAFLLNPSYFQMANLRFCSIILFGSRLRDCCRRMFTDHMSKCIAKALTD